VKIQGEWCAGPKYCVRFFKALEVWCADKVWQMLLDRIQTKENLWRRRIIQQQQTNCVLCGAAMESTVHLFLHCPISSKVWYVMRWLGLVIVVPPNLVSAFGTL
jgi:RNA polymerase subunit RPABC4/transcription elongation factor Spt4